MRHYVDVSSKVQKQNPAKKEILVNDLKELYAYTQLIHNAFVLGKHEKRLRAVLDFFLNTFLSSRLKWL